MRKSSRTAILVAGMHRSGTSALTRVISVLGADLPPDLLAPAADNAPGFWESKELVALGEALLKALDTDPLHFEPLPPEWQQTPAAAEYRAGVTSYLAREFGSSPLFVLKDPQFCRVMPAMIAAIESQGIGVRIAIPYRNPAEVAASLYYRNDLPVERGLLLWLRYVLDAENWSRGHPRSFVSYAALLADWRSTIEKLRKDLDLRAELSPGGRPGSFRSFAEVLADCRSVLRKPRKDLALRSPLSLYHRGPLVSAFLSAAERHQNLPDELARVHPWVSDAYQALQRLDRRPTDRQARACLDDIAARLARQKNALSRFTADQTRWGEILANQLGDPRRLAGATMRLGLTDAELDDQRHAELAGVANWPQLASGALPLPFPVGVRAIARARGNGEEQAERLGQAEAVAEQASAAHAGVQAEAAELRRLLAEGEAVRAELAQEADAARAALSERDAILADLRQEAAEREAVVERQRRDAESAGAELAQRDLNVAELERRLSEREAALSKEAEERAAERLAAQTRQQESEAQLAQVRRELAEQHHAFEAERDGLRHQLAEHERALAAARRQAEEGKAVLAEARLALTEQQGTAEALRGELSLRDAALAETSRRAEERAAELLAAQIRQQESEVELAQVRRELAEQHQAAEAERDGLRHQLAERERTLAAARRQAEEQIVLLIEGKAVLAETKLALTERQRTAEALRGELTVRDAALAAARRQAEERAAELLVAQTRQQESEAQLAQVRRELAEQHQAAEAERDGLRNQLAERERALAATETAVSELRGELALRDEALVATRQQAEEQAAALAAAQTRQQESEAQLAQVRRELAEQHQAAEAERDGLRSQLAESARAFAVAETAVSELRGELALRDEALAAARQQAEEQIAILTEGNAVLAEARRALTEHQGTVAVQRGELNGRDEVLAAARQQAEERAVAPQTAQTSDIAGEIPTEITLHIEQIGDCRFAGEGWVGTRGEQLRVEAFSIRPTDKLEASDVEYMAFSPHSREIPWVSGDQLCGTRGRGLPLTGFAVRLAPHLRDRFAVVYEGSFFARGVVGPAEDGELCTSGMVDDPLEAINVRIVERTLPGH